MKRTEKTHYQKLGLEPDVSSTEIKRAYRKLVKDIHPDTAHSKKSDKSYNLATEKMIELNEAYEILMDKSKRAKYDGEIGLKRFIKVAAFSADMLKEDDLRKVYLSKIFHPARTAIMRMLNRYKQELQGLSFDIYDENLLATFEQYVQDYEFALSKAANLLASTQNPRSLDAAVQLLRHSIARSVDGLDEMHLFCANFNYDHLTMAQTLVAIAQDLSRRSLKLSKS